MLPETWVQETESDEVSSSSVEVEWPLTMRNSYLDDRCKVVF